MVARARWVTVAMAAALVLSACQPNRIMGGWIPYWGADSGSASLSSTDSARLYGEVSYMWYGTNADGSVSLMSSADSLATAVAAARSKGLPVIPTVFDRQPAGVMSGIVTTPALRDAHVQAIVDLVVSNGYDGVDIDYEVFAFGDGKANWSTITPGWVQFVRSLGNELHSRGKLLSVTVPPVWTINTSTVVGYTVYAQDQIAPFVDRLRLMVYDWSVSSPGPIEPVSWVNSVIAYSSKVVPVKKLQLGVPAYGRHWTTQKVSTEVCPDGALKKPDSITFKEVAALAKAAGRTPVRDATGELTFTWEVKVTGPRTAPITPPTYTPPSTTIPSITSPAGGSPLQPAVRLAPPTGDVTCTVKHTVYVPDAVTLKDRASRALNAGWSGIVMWAMGYETADVYSRLAELPISRPNGAPTVGLDAPYVSGTTVRLTGWAFHPEYDLPVAVHITIAQQGPNGTSTQVLDSVVTANANRGGIPKGLGPFHGIRTQYTLAAGTYSLCATTLKWGGGAATATKCATAVVTG